MPTPRKSLAELATSGTLAKNLGRYQSRIAALPTTISPVGRAPAHLKSAQRAIWAEITRAAPPGVLAKSDRIIVEVLVELLYKVRTSEGRTSEYNAIVTVLGKLGMTPPSRQAMNIERVLEPHEKAAQTAEDLLWAELDA